IIGLNPIADGITVQGGAPAAGDVTVTIGAAGIHGTAVLTGLGADITGSYTFGGVTLQAGPNSAELYPVFSQGPASAAFNFSDPVGDLLTGDISWKNIQDNTTNPKFFGTMTVTAVTGVTPGFAAAFLLNSPSNIDFTTTALAVGGQARTLDLLVANKETATVGVS